MSWVVRGTAAVTCAAVASHAFYTDLTVLPRVGWLFVAYLFFFAGFFLAEVMDAPLIEEASDV